MQRLPGRRLALAALLLGAAAGPTAGFVVPAAPRVQGQARGSGVIPLASSYYDNYDAQKARNMEQDRCVS